MAVRATAMLPMDDSQAMSSLTQLPGLPARGLKVCS